MSIKQPEFRTGLVRLLFSLGIILPATGLFFPAIADETPVVACTYNLVLDKTDAGDIFLERQAGANGTIGIGTALEVKVSGGWGSWHLRSSGRAVVDGERLLRFGHRITEDKKSWRITGEFADKALWCNAREVPSKQAMEDDELTGLALSVAGREFSCWKFSGTSDDEKSLYWVARDRLGAFVVQETGRDKDGPYNIRLKSYKTGERIK